MTPQSNEVRRVLSGIERLCDNADRRPAGEYRGWVSTVLIRSLLDEARVVRDTDPED